MATIARLRRADRQGSFPREYARALNRLIELQMEGSTMADDDPNTIVDTMETVKGALHGAGTRGAFIPSRADRALFNLLRLDEIPRSCT